MLSISAQQSMCLLFVVVFILFQLICENHIFSIVQRKALFNLGFRADGLCGILGVRLDD